MTMNPAHELANWFNQMQPVFKVKNKHRLSRNESIKECLKARQLLWEQRQLGLSLLNQRLIYDRRTKEKCQEEMDTAYLRTLRQIEQYYEKRPTNYPFHYPTC